MKIIVGLGNPEPKYQHNRHNAGFRAVDALAEKLSASFTEENRFSAQTAAIDIGGQKVVLVKPQTFMNDSGQAVAAVKNFFKASNGDMLVVHDEIDLPLGAVRLSKDSGAAGHNGVASVIENVGKDFTRLRIGIENREEYRIPETDAYVLQNFKPEEEMKLEKEIIPQAVAEIEKFLK